MCDSRVLQDAMRAVGLERLGKDDLPVQVSNQLVREMVDRQADGSSKFTETGRVGNAREGELGYDLRQSSHAQSHPLAKSIVKRMTEDMATFSEQCATVQKFRLRDVAASFDASDFTASWPRASHLQQRGGGR